ncbi:uncharacterized protein TNCV_641371 [Trichonephila clavipes]|nr:uncharacterized protein TNCV_641371 [Trichonephila clavipes]
MDDNATCHRTLAVQDCLDSEGIQRLVWPARSPDLNPIENVWDALGRQVAGRDYPPTNKNTLIRALTEEWDKLPQQLLDNVVQSMVRRVECCITLHGGHIPIFEGRPTEADWLEESHKLADLVRKEPLIDKSYYYTAWYDPPYQLFHRINEIWMVKKAEKQPSTNAGNEHIPVETKDHKAEK